ncbi:MAG: ethylbenzene dehydrogenase-related protein [Methanosarcinales archaeon]
MDNNVRYKVLKYKYIFTIGLLLASFLGISIALSANTDQQKELVLVAKYIEGDISLDPYSAIWKDVQGTEVPLTFQALFIPWGKSAKGPVTVKALHNGKEIYFMLEWSDETKNIDTSETDQFADASAIMFPLKETNPSSIMMGFLSRVNIWYWRSDRDLEYWTGTSNITTAVDFYPEDEVIKLFKEPKEVGPVQDLVAEGPGTLTQKERKSDVLGKGLWRENKWRVVFKRTMKTIGDDDFQFEAGKKINIAFAVWDGEKQERGPRKSISDWVMLKIEKR